MDENRQVVFVDANFFIALFHPQDSLHKRAVVVARTQQKEQWTLVSSIFVFHEIVTILSMKRGREVAIGAGEYIQKQVRLVYLTEQAFHKSWELFREVKGKNISFVDCSTAVLLRAEGIVRLLSFDVKDFRPLQRHCRFRLID